MPAAPLRPPFDEPRARALLDTMSDGAVRELSCYLHRADGLLLPVRVTAAALGDADGWVVGAIETVTDMIAARERIAASERLDPPAPVTGGTSTASRAESVRPRAGALVRRGDGGAGRNRVVAR